MPYDWSTIEALWLGDSRVAIPPSRLLDGFNTAESHLGVEWVERHRVTGDVVTMGSWATLPVAVTGLKLRAVESAPGFANLLSRLRANDSAAYSELSGSFLCIRGLNTIRLEFGAPVQVGERTRRPDFRLALGASVWTHVEVTTPNRSEATRRAEALIQAIAERMMTLPAGATIETLLLRDPSPEELERLVHKTIALATTKQVLTEEIGDLAIVTVNRLPPGIMEPQNYGRDLGHILGFAKGFVEGGVPNKTVSVRVPIVDQRAEGFLTTEARQLPTHEPGLIMIDMTSVPGGFPEWEALLVRRLQPQIHTRVSAILLFHSGIRSTDEGEAIIPETRLIENVHAVHRLPEWLRDQLVASSGVAFGSAA